MFWGWLHSDQLHCFSCRSDVHWVKFWSGAHIRWQPYSNLGSILSYGFNRGTIPGAADEFNFYRRSELYNALPEWAGSNLRRLDHRRGYQELCWNCLPGFWRSAALRL